MIKIPFQVWLIPFLMGVFFYSCKDPVATNAAVYNMDLRLGVCGAAVGLIALIIITSIPKSWWN